MAKYLIQASYTAEGAKGVLTDGGTGRRKAIEQMLAGMGGRLECLYFGFGESDAYLIVEVPDNVTATAVSVRVGASGAARCRTTVLLSPEEMDQAVKKGVTYRPPGA